MFRRLKGLSVSDIRKLERIGRDYLKPLKFTLSVTDVEELQSELEWFFFEGRVNYSYAVQLARGIEIAKRARHFKSKNTLYEDIIYSTNKRIYIKSYSI